MNKRNILNSIYEPVIVNAEKIYKELKKIYENISLGFYNNHFHKNDAGEYAADCFPIPVITIKDVCDIEIDIDLISVTSKMSKTDMISFDYRIIEDYKFEIYGVNNYLEDYYMQGISFPDMLFAIEESEETEFFFTFYLETDMAKDKLYRLINCLSENKFYC